MIKPKEGETEFTVMNHYDDSKRVSTRTQRYFYGPIEDTPFTLAIVLPEKYGSHEFVSQQEIRHSRNNGKFFLKYPSLIRSETLLYIFSVTEYFKGDNWRVHPDWVYCEYNSVSDLEKERESSGEYSSRDQEPSFGSPEEQVLHFLSRAGRPGWKWMSVSNLTWENGFSHGGYPSIPHYLYGKPLPQSGSTQVAAATSQHAQWLQRRQCARIEPLWIAASKLSGISQG